MFRTVRYEQAVYGAFPFWNRGYEVLTRSAGCRAEWLSALKLAAQRFGEQPTGVAETSSLFALCLPLGPWMIVSVSPQGTDDQERPGALAFHGLFVSRWAYWWSGSSPFPFASAFRDDWNRNDQDRLMPAGQVVLPCLEPTTATDKDSLVNPIVEAMRLGRKVVLASADPIDDLATAVWRRLPARIRHKASVATWAFSTANGFDLVAVPRIAGTMSDSSVLILEHDPDNVRLDLRLPADLGRL
jgi:hypothetical protein